MYHHDNDFSSLWEVPGSPELLKHSNEIDLDDIDMNGFQHLWGNQDVSHQGSTSPVCSTPSHSQIPNSRPLEHLNHYQNEGSPSAFSMPSLSSSAVTSKRKHSAMTSFSSHQQEPLNRASELASRYHAFKKYAWQREMSQEDVEMVFRRIGRHWRPMVRSTFLNAMDRLGQHLQEKQERIKPILQDNESVIDLVVEDTAPAPPRDQSGTNRKTAPAPLMTMDAFLASDVPNRGRRTKNYLTDLTLRRQNSKRPKWAPAGMDIKTQRAFLTGLATLWETTEVNARSSLYKQKPERIPQLIKSVLPDYQSTNVADMSRLEEHQLAAKSRRQGKRRKTSQDHV